MGVIIIKIFKTSRGMDQAWRRISLNLKHKIWFIHPCKTLNF